MKPRLPKRKRLSPPEKKALSLRKDRRSDWWEYEVKGCRSRARAGSHRIARRENKLELLSDPERAESRFALRQKRRWRKKPGITLGEDIHQKRDRRAESHGRKSRRRGPWTNS